LPNGHAFFGERALIHTIIRECNHYTLEQKELKARLKEQSIENPDQIDLEAAI